MTIVDAAYKAIQQDSIIWADPAIRTQIAQNYREINPEADPRMQLLQLIYGVAADCLFVTFPDATKVTPKGIETVTVPPAISCNVMDGGAGITIPHFDGARQAEWDMLYEQIDAIKAQPKIEICLRGNQGKNGRVALEFLTKLFGKPYVDRLYHELYKDATFKWRVSSANLKELQEFKTPNRAFQAHLDDVVSKMQVSDELAVTTQVPDHDAPEEAEAPPQYTGKITLEIDEHTKGAAQMIYLMLKNEPNVTVWDTYAKWKLQRFGEVKRVELESGLVLHFPKKEEVLKP